MFYKVFYYYSLYVYFVNICLILWLLPLYSLYIIYWNCVVQILTTRDSIYGVRRGIGDISFWFAMFVSMQLIVSTEIIIWIVRLVSHFFPDDDGYLELILIYNADHKLDMMDKFRRLPDINPVVLIASCICCILTYADDYFFA